MTEWITDRRPLPVDGDGDGDVSVRRRPGRDEFHFMHAAYVGLGTPWRHTEYWTFPQIRIGQTWHRADGKLVRVICDCGGSTPWLIDGLRYTDGGNAPGAPDDFRLAELFSEPQSGPGPEPEHIPDALRTGAEHFYVLVVTDDAGGKPGGEPIVFEHQVPAATSLRAVSEQQKRIGSRYGTTYIAKCHIRPEFTRQVSSSEVPF